MKVKTAKAIGHIVGVLIAVFIFLAVCAVSWIVTCGIIKLITLCFGWTFTWKLATGVWLVMFLLRSIFKGGGKRD